MIKMELARRRTLDFCEVTKPGWITAPHHRLLCEAADDFISGKITRLIVCLPPRHTKSEIFSIRMPARALGVNPAEQLLHISYAASLSNTFSQQVRDLVRSDLTYRELFPNTVIHPDRQRIDDWMTTKAGTFRSVGVGAGISGRGATKIIMDDVHKEGDQFSMTTLDQTFDWYLTAVRTRLAPGGGICIPMTRWALADMVGRLLDLMKADKKADQWTVITLPALAGKWDEVTESWVEGDEPDLLNRKPGEALWAERYDVSWMAAQRALSPTLFAGLYLQEPQPLDAKLFFKDDFLRGSAFGGVGADIVWTFDLAISEDEAADFSCWGRWTYLVDSMQLCVEKIAHQQHQWPEIKKQIVALMDEYPNDVFAFPKHVIELMAVQELAALGSEYARRIRPVKLPGDKRARAAAYSDVVKTGRAFVEAGEMGDLFIQEHDRFQDVHDDFVDMSSVATHHFGIHKQFKAHILREERRVVDPEMEAWLKANGTGYEA